MISSDTHKTYLSKIDPPTGWLHIYLFIFTIICLFMLLQRQAQAKVTGRCDNCHTMHNSQDGTDVDPSGPNPYLTSEDCLGCHAQGTGNKTEPPEPAPGTSQIPQVYHNDLTGDLAAGNFAYIDGTKGGAPSDAKGHNVIDLFGVDSDGDLDFAPGGQHPGYLNDSGLTCAGYIGCHGIRPFDSPETKGILALKGAHHGNVDGKCNDPDTVAKSYRFLRGVKGLENTIDKWQNVGENSHNEYYGITDPVSLNGCGDGSTSCHRSEGFVVAPPNNTITEFCGTCHPNFHGTDNIGGSITSPFTRHPTDVLLPTTGEYEVRTYNAQAPVGRTSVPESIIPDATVNDVVTCLSCHAAHGSPYADLLKWNYQGMIAGGGGDDGSGCFVCHTEKDGP